MLPYFFSSFQDFAGFLGTVFNFTLSTENHTLYFFNVLAVIGLLFLAQWAFLRPGRGWKVRVNATGRPLKTSVFAAALMAALLTTGLAALVLELPNWWQNIIYDQEADNWDIGNHLIIWAAMLVLWAIWAGIFFLYWKQGDRYTQMGRMIRGLIAGSILETIIAVPVHIWAVKQRDCYCGRGSYTTLVLSAAVLIWAFGPGIVLLYMREKRRIEKINAAPNLK